MMGDLRCWFGFHHWSERQPASAVHLSPNGESGPFLDVTGSWMRVCTRRWDAVEVWPLMDEAVGGPFPELLAAEEQG